MFFGVFRFLLLGWWIGVVSVVFNSEFTAFVPVDFARPGEWVIRIPVLNRLVHIIQTYVLEWREGRLIGNIILPSGSFGPEHIYMVVKDKSELADFIVLCCVLDTVIYVAVVRNAVVNKGVYVT